MSNWTEEASGISSEPLKLNTVYLQAKEFPIDSGKTEIVFWDGEKDNIAFEGSEEFFLLDRAYIRTGFVADENISLKSNFIFRETKEAITVYKKGQHAGAFSSDKEAKAFIAEKAGTCSLKYVLFLMNKDGIFTLTTNGTLAMDNIGNLQRPDAYWTLVESKRYSRKDSNISAKAHGFLSKVQKAMFPNYAYITEGSKIEFGDKEEQSKFKDLIKHYKDWKKSYIEKCNGVKINTDLSKMESEPSALTEVKAEEDDVPF